MIAQDAVRFGELSRDVQQRIAELIDLQEEMEANIGDITKVLPAYYNFKCLDASPTKKERLTKEEREIVGDIDDLYKSLMECRKTLLKMKAKVEPSN